MRPVSRQSLAVLNHPDQRSGWAIVMVAHLRDPGVSLCALDEVAEVAPLVSARLRGDGWQAAAAGPIAELPDALDPELVGRRFDLARESPLRVARSPRTLTLVGHHAAFDGLALAGVLSLLLGGDGLISPRRVPEGVATGASTGRSSGMVRRLLRPADRVPPSHSLPRGDAFAGRPVTVPGGSFTAALAAAVADVVAQRLPRKDAGRIGISLAVAGRQGFENTASYRRIDVDPDADALALVSEAMSRADEPRELSNAPRLVRGLGFLARWASDTFLLSNLGRLTLPHVERLDFYPVARGRSAVAIGAAGIEGGQSSVTLRARDLNQADAEILLDEIVERLAEAPPPG
jgi:hypothetical protein